MARCMTGFVFNPELLLDCTESDERFLLLPESASEKNPNSTAITIQLTTDNLCKMVVCLFIYQNTGM